MAELSESPSKNLVDPILKDQVDLKLIRVSGQTHVFHFSPSITASEIAEHVFQNWPEAWTEGRGTTSTFLRLIYQGRFLDENATLRDLKLPAGKTTVMHLVSRETVPEPQSTDTQNEEKTRSSRCKVCCCTIL